MVRNGGAGLRPAPAGGKEVIEIAESESVMDGEMVAEIERLKAELAEAQTRGLEAYRRALLAENSGRIVPEMVMGATAEEMERSLGAAREAFEAAKAAAMAEMATTQVPAGNPIRQGPGIETMSPLEKIAYGLKRD